MKNIFLDGKSAIVLLVLVVATMMAMESQSVAVATELARKDLSQRENKMKIKANDIVQISPEVDHQGGFWAGNLLVVTEVHEWGVQGFCRGTEGYAYIRLKFDQIEKVGRLAWVPED